MEQDQSDNSKTEDKILCGNDLQSRKKSRSSDSKDQTAELPVPRFYDDSPINSPDEDILDHDVFAKSIARCILGIKNANGGAIAIHGPWGSGKSSVINLVRHELKSSEESVIIISFSSWNYRFEDGIVAGFFQELYLGLVRNPNISALNLRRIKRLGLYVKKVTSVSSSLVSIPILGAAVSVTSDFIDYLFNKDQRIEDIQREIGEELMKEDKRILVIIDDIDRLSKEEAIAVFRLIKSVGRLKNVIYLLAYDREITERMIKDIYPFEGSHYLEKIIQVNFSLPMPDRSILIKMLSIGLDKIFGNEMSHNSKRTHTIISEIVVPELKTPRDVYRLINMLAVTYQSVEGSVNIVDFIALETIRLFRPHIYYLIQSNKSILTEFEDPILDKDDLEAFVDGVILGGEPKSSRAMWKKALMKIFPVLNFEFSEFAYSYVQEWNQEKRVCSELNFDKYFNFSVVGDVVSDIEFQEFARQAGDGGYIKSILRSYAATIDSRSGRTKASFLLEKIARGAEHIDDEDSWELLTTIYSIADELRYNSEDIVKNFGYRVDNGDRIIDLTKRIITSRSSYFDEFEDMIYVYEVAPLDLLLRLACFIEDYATRFDDDGEAAKVEPESDYIMNVEATERRLNENKSWREMKKNDVRKLRLYVLERVGNAISDGSIFENENLFDILANWRRIVEEAYDVSRMIRATLKKSDKFFISIAKNYNNPLFLDFQDEELNQVRFDWVREFLDDDQFTTNLRAILRRSDLTQRDRDVAIQLIELVDGDEISRAMS